MYALLEFLFSHISYHELYLCCLRTVICLCCSFLPNFLLIQPIHFKLVLPEFTKQRCSGQGCQVLWFYDGSDLWLSWSVQIFEDLDVQLIFFKDFVEINEIIYYMNLFPFQHFKQPILLNQGMLPCSFHICCSFMSHSRMSHISFAEAHWETLKKSSKVKA